MSLAPDDTCRRLLEACSFAARAHGRQLRKDGSTPYVSHPFRVCLIAGKVFGVEDPAVLTAAVLHDCVEDTSTDFDDLAEAFGADVAGWVAALSKDKRLPEPEREQGYAEALRRAPWQAKVCKLADVYDNLLDSASADPHRLAKTFKNAHRYLDAVAHGLPDSARSAWEAASRLLAALEAKAAGQAGGA